MALSAQILIDNLNNSELTLQEQVICDYLERLYDKEILKNFYSPSVSITLNKSDYFTKILKDANINKGRNNIIFSKLQELYDAAGWLLTFQITPAAEILKFTVKP